MSSFKKLSKSDVSLVPYHANKHWNVLSASINTFSTIYNGRNPTSSFASSSTPGNSNGVYDTLIYSQINQLFYQSYTSSLDTSSLMFSFENYESASQQRPTSSYFIYNDSDKFTNSYPTGFNEKIKVLAINQDIYGNKIEPNNFILSSSAYYIIDDNFGNLLNVSTSFLQYISNSYFSPDDYFINNPSAFAYTHVGNIFYAQGLAVITNQSFQNIFTSSFSLHFENEHTIYENEVRCLIKESDFNLSYNPTLLISGSQYIVTSGSQASGSVYTLTGSIDSTIKDFATGSILSSGSYFRPYATQLGLYNDNNELLAVAKFGKPIMMSPDTDMTFVVKYDT